MSASYETNATSSEVPTPDEDAPTPSSRKRIGNFHANKGTIHVIDETSPFPNTTHINSSRKEFLKNHPEIANGKTTIRQMPISLSADYYRTYEFLQKSDTKTFDWLYHAFARDSKSGTVRNDIAFLKSLCYFLGVCSKEAFKDSHILEAEKILIKRIRVEKDRERSEKNAYELINKYMAWQHQQGFAGNTQRGRYSCICAYINWLDLANIDADKARKKVRLPRMEQARDIDLTRDEVKMILNYARYWHKRRLMAALSSGLNPIDLFSLRVKNVHFDEDPVRVEALRAKTGTNIETFFSKEAMEFIKAGVDINNPEQLLFDDDPDHWKMSDEEYQKTHAPRLAQNSSGAFHKLLGLVAQYEPEFAKRKLYSARKVAGSNKNMWSISLKTFTRKFFTSHASKAVDIEFVRCWLGHKEYWQTYMRKPLEERQLLYRNAEAYLTIYRDLSDRRQEELKQLKATLTFFGLSDRDIAEIEEKALHTDKAMPEFAKQIVQEYGSKMIFAKPGSPAPILIQDSTEKIPEDYVAMASMTETDPAGVKAMIAARQKLQGQTQTNAVSTNDLQSGLQKKKRIIIKTEELQRYLDDGYEPLESQPLQSQGQLIMRLVG